MDQDLTRTAEWQRLEEHQAGLDPFDLRGAFATGPTRAEQLTVEGAGLVLDLSKNLVTSRTVGLLCELARARGVPERIEAMFSGERLNATEDRAVLHVALRAERGSTLLLDGQDVVAPSTRSSTGWPPSPPPSGTARGWAGPAGRSAPS